MVLVIAVEVFGDDVREVVVVVVFVDVVDYYMWMDFISRFNFKSIST